MNDYQIQESLKKLNGWNYQEKTLVKEFKFDNFLKSVEFVNQVAPLAEKMNHHPNLQIAYSKVTVTLTTHDSGGVTQKDFDLAMQIEYLI